MHYKKTGLIAALLATVSATAVHAQEAVQDEGLGGDIIVTSQKFEQKLRDVPITITAVTQEQMKRLGVDDLDELSNYVPGLNIQEQSANNPGIVIRGITSDSGSAQQAARVTLYYNGVDISRSRGAYQAIYDVDRIEVVKGPQATLFGTASTIGAVSIISARPKPGVSGELTAGYGNYNAYLVGGHLNVGNDVIAARVAGEFKKRDGYVENLSPTQDDLYAQNQLGLRASVRYTPTPALTVDLIGTYDRQRNSGTPFISKRFATSQGPGNPFGAANLSGSPLSKQVFGKDKLGLTRDVYDVNLTARYDLGDGWSFTTVNGYRKFDSLEVFDADGSAAWWLEFAEGAYGAQLSHESRFAYVGDHVRTSFGWNVFHENNRQEVPFSTEEGIYLQCAANLIPALGCVSATGVVTAAQATSILTKGAATQIPYSSIFTNKGINDQYSMFGEVTWMPVHQLEVTAGIRALIEQRKSGYVSIAPNSVLSKAPLIPGQVTTKGTLWSQDSFQAFLPRFNVLYRLNDAVNLYATISKGRRSPVVNQTATTTGIIPEETVWNYEGGVKLSSGMFAGSLGVYYQKYRNFQISRTVTDANDPSGRPVGSSITESAGTAGNLGFEAEGQLRPTNWLTLFANGGYIDGGIDKTKANGIYAGNRFRLQPRVQWAAGLTVDAPVGNGIRVFATPSVTYRSKIYFEIPNKEAISQGPVTLVNVKAGMRFAEGRYEIAGFVRNAANEKYLLDAGNTGGGFNDPTYIPAEPRFYGVQLTGRF
ncbi:TonB-dependent receptor [Sphingomonas sp. ABOLE]|uniref:TonB-dependent receptor n=1 Tax=Sphingomonas sp. ABOLE TaxID=1985878 RepID=UPI000F7F83CF|nr:TonB-dependent receptor [Sphingomonas sp. ABOLE]RSV43462.1 TonB-dependent receptor [Sphingomonas sp. ABOLE]